MLAAICDREKSDHILVGAILEEKMKNRQEPLKMECFDLEEDLIEQYENGKRYDLVILDIHKTGITTARQIRTYDRKTAILLFASCADYALESYEVHAMDYLLKPIRKERLEDSIHYFLEQRYPRIKQSLLLINGSSGRRIAYNNIIYIESLRMKLRVVCRDGVEHTIRKKLDEVQNELPGNRFLRCNQSFIVNMDYIKEADTNFTMINGDKIPIKVRETKKIREQYFDYLRRNEEENSKYDKFNAWDDV